MATSLSTYLTEVQRLLHDANNVFWSQAELTDYINQARNRVVRDTGALRTIQTANVTANVETYTYNTTLPNGNVTMDILNINLFWGNTRVPLYYMPWTDFNAQLRFWQNYQGRPVAFSIYGPQQFYVGPTPDQTYTIEADTVIAPQPLVNTTDIDTIPDPWTDPVPVYAAYLAKYKEQSYGEAEIFLQQYRQRIQAVLSGTMTRRLFSPYIMRS
ncbi:MAG: hypothetical protein KGJ13_11135 [Patescibacteria group bacterium]|nr:hypothetical protein [Patescibacteria group bacterium]